MIERMSDRRKNIEADCVLDVMINSEFTYMDMWEIANALVHDVDVVRVALEYLFENQLVTRIPIGDGMGFGWRLAN